MDSRSETMRKGGNNAKDREVRKQFLFAYENTYGNVRRACAFAGISRQTYYRWMKGDSSADKWFQRRIELIHPLELKLDHAEIALMALVEAGNMRAIKFALQSYGRNRGW